MGFNFITHFLLITCCTCYLIQLFTVPLFNYSLTFDLKNLLSNVQLQDEYLSQASLKSPH